MAGLITKILDSTTYHSSLGERVNISKAGFITDPRGSEFWMGLLMNPQIGELISASKIKQIVQHKTYNYFLGFKSMVLGQLDLLINPLLKAKSLVCGLLFSDTILGKIFSTPRKDTLVKKIPDLTSGQYCPEIARRLEKLLQSNPNILTELRSWLNENLKSRTSPHTQKLLQQMQHKKFIKLYELLFPNASVASAIPQNGSALLMPEAPLSLFFQPLNNEEKRETGDLELSSLEQPATQLKSSSSDSHAVLEIQKDFAEEDAVVETQEDTAEEDRNVIELSDLWSGTLNP